MSLINQGFYVDAGGVTQDVTKPSSGKQARVVTNRSDGQRLVYEGREAGIGMFEVSGDFTWYPTREAADAAKIRK